MLEDQGAGLHALGAGRADVILVDGVQHAGAGELGNIAGVVEGQTDDRHHIAFGVRQAAAEGGQPLKLHRKGHQQQRCQHEGRHRDADGGHHAQEAVDPLAPVVGRNAAQRDADDHCQHKGIYAKLERKGELALMEDDPGDACALLHLQRGAQISLQIAFDVVEKLHVQGLVQPVLGVGAGDHLRRGLFRQKGAARDRVHQQEGDTHDEQQRQERHHDALYDISCHSDPSQRLLIEGSASPQIGRRPGTKPREALR